MGVAIRPKYKIDKALLVGRVSGKLPSINRLTPFITAVLSAIWLGENSLSWNKLLAYILGIAGLSIMFHSALHISYSTAMGVLGVLLATFLQSFSAVWVKRIHAQLPAITQVTTSKMSNLSNKTLQNQGA
jgi:drug/metabolite transporter (DMT)-like permease